MKGADLRYLFLDLNAYFASVEQQEVPELRGRPIAVVPLISDRTFVIAASYEAKRHGVKTVMRVDRAKELCPSLELVVGRPSLYVHYHDLVIEAVDSVLPVEKVCSIDEMYFRLLGEEREPARARELALEIKLAIRASVGQHIRCSIGIAPNPFLAKIATEMQKPDGLVVLQRTELPDRLYGLELMDLPGINRRMQVRLNAAGIFSVRDLCERSGKGLRGGFGSVIGERWWHLLRGEDIQATESARKFLGHSHVMAPEYRTEEGCKQVLLRLLQKASARLRAEGLATKSMIVGIEGRKSWRVHVRVPPTNDSVTLTEALLSAWDARTFSGPLKAWITFHDLLAAESVTGSLFDRTAERIRLSRTVDGLNQKFGKNTVYLAAIEKAKLAAPERIAFGKTALFAEGKGDNQWIDPFRSARNHPQSE